jgi:hypothetical protein
MVSKTIGLSLKPAHDAQADPVGLDQLALLSQFA